jgi:nicotinamidase-related amidase
MGLGSSFVLDAAGGLSRDRCWEFRKVSGAPNENDPARFDELANRLFTALREGEYETAATCFSTQATLWINGQFRGPVSVVLPEMKAQGSPVGPHTHEEIRRLFAKGGFVEQHVARWRGSDGQARELAVCAVVQVGSDGLVTRFEEYYDNAVFLAGTEGSSPPAAGVGPELNEERTHLHLRPASTALLLMDLQGGVAGLDTSPRSVAEVVRCSARLALAGRAAGALVIWIRGGGEPDGGDAWRPETGQPPAKGPRPTGWDQLLPDLGAEPLDLLITKRQWGAFYGTDLDLQLRRRGIDTLVIGGIATNFVVESTAREASERGYRLIFVEDAMAARSLEEHQYPLARIFPRIGRVVSSIAVESLLLGK